MKASFSLRTKDELARVFSPGECCKKAEFVALAAEKGDLEFFRVKEFPRLATTNAALARKLYRLSKVIFLCCPQVEIKPLKQGRGHLYLLHFTASSLEERWAIVKTVQEALLTRGCCQRAYLRGVFLKGGSVNNPQKGYHLEVSAGSPEACLSLCSLMQSLELTPHLALRKGKGVCYLKEGEQIAEFLGLTGAYKALFEFENVRIFKEVKNEVNRTLNCETANLAKAISAAARQLESIHYLKEKKELEKLSPALKEAAEIRLAYPEASLSELGKMFSPSLGKSGVNHRLRQLIRHASFLAKEERGI